MVRFPLVLMCKPMRKSSNGNIYAPVIMMAEKAADLIQGKRPLDPIDVPFYQVNKGMPLYAEGEEIRDHKQKIKGADH